MRKSYGLTHAILQSSLTELILVAYNIYVLSDIKSAFTSTASLLLFNTLFTAIFTILLYRKFGYWLRAILIPVFSSLLLTLFFTFYPQLGFDVEWYVLLPILILAGIVSHILLLSAGAYPGGKKQNDY